VAHHECSEVWFALNESAGEEIFYIISSLVHVISRNLCATALEFYEQDVTHHWEHRFLEAFGCNTGNRSVSEHNNQVWSWSAELFAAVVSD
jgi:hypothetical protein